MEALLPYIDNTHISLSSARESLYCSLAVLFSALGGWVGSSFFILLQGKKKSREEETKIKEEKKIKR